MIILVLKGGLGNQLFQLAFAEYLANKYNKKLYIDDKYLLYNRLYNTSRDFSLNVLDSIQYRRINIFLSFIIFIFLKIKIKFKNIKVISDINADFDKKINSELYILNGYFQNLKIQKKIISNFINTRNLNKKYLLKYNNFKNSVCIHIRRSDYLKYTDIYHIQELTYYIKAIEYLRKISNNNVYLFFTDDPIWVKENFKIDNLTSFISSTNNVINDFIEMSNCNNFIISNSTFSFWAAQFSNNSNKIIIYPKLWFKNIEKNNILINNIIPDNWISF